MAGSKATSFGTTFAFGAASPPAAIAGVIDIDGAGSETTQVQFGAVDDASRAVSFRNGRVKNGAMTVNFEYRGANYTTLKALEGHGPPMNFKIVYADGSNETGTANLAKLGKVKVPEDDRHTFTAEFQVITSTFTEAT